MPTRCSHHPCWEARPPPTPSWALAVSPVGASVPTTFFLALSGTGVHLTVYTGLRLRVKPGMLCPCRPLLGRNSEYLLALLLLLTPLLSLWPLVSMESICPCVLRCCLLPRQGSGQSAVTWGRFPLCSTAEAEDWPSVHVCL